MRVNQCIRCTAFPCSDVDHGCYIVPDVAIKAEDISIVMISEAAPANPADYYYAGGDPLFAQTTVQAFNDAGAAVKSIKDILDSCDFAFRGLSDDNGMKLELPIVTLAPIVKQYAETFGAVFE
ncbi:MAG: hypothetical protein M1434_05885, partial [Chloroflexi bacterium]|nr:hypothetical protein [Chloroflexota bacterium]MCL5274263.1 hypothetical protein [Chloroflexota bacterium]